MAQPAIAIHQVDAQVWHVGFKPNPWNWVGWEHAENGRFRGRWDDPTGTWRTKYVGESLLSCFLEVLAHFRNDAVFDAEFDQINDRDEDRGDYPTAHAGTVDPAWLEPRTIGTAHLAGHFCRITAATTIATLYPRFRKLARSMGLDDFDAAALKDGRPRQLTQAVSELIYESTTTDGIEFSSRHGDDLTLWAIYERPGDLPFSRKLSHPENREIEYADPSLSEAFRLLNLRWGAKSC